MTHWVTDDSWICYWWHTEITEADELTIGWIAYREWFDGKVEQLPDPPIFERPMSRAEHREFFYNGPKPGHWTEAYGRPRGFVSQAGFSLNEVEGILDAME